MLIFFLHFAHVLYAFTCIFCPHLIHICTYVRLFRAYLHILWIFYPNSRILRAHFHILSIRYIYFTYVWRIRCIRARSLINFLFFVLLFISDNIKMRIKILPFVRSIFLPKRASGCPKTSYSRNTYMH